MREVAFIKQNAEKWERLEALIKQPADAQPDEISELYIQLTDDLAYAKTFYPKGNTARYLNELTGHYHRYIYKNKRESRTRLITFWTHEIPLAVYEHQRALLVSLLIFVCATAIGSVSSAYDENYTRLILGDYYVNMTENNIEQGDPMGVYRDMESANMFFGIADNNIRVSFFAYVMGIFASLGSAYLIFSNGLMVGAFQTMFYKKGLLVTCLLAIYLHGALELSAIVIAGGAGIALGNSWLFPGTYTRMQGLLRGAKSSLKIVLGLVPVFICAAFIESFVTRHYNIMPTGLRIGIIAVSFAFILWYYVFYPIILSRRGRFNNTDN